MPPANVQVEEQLLGALLANPEQWEEIKQLVTADDFSERRLGHVWAAMDQLHAQGSAVDLVTVMEVLRANKLLDAVGGATGLSELVQHSGTLRAAKEYALITAENSRQRTLQQYAQGILDSIGRGESSDKILERLESVKERLKPRLTGKIELVQFAETIEAAEKLRAKTDEIVGLATGWKQFDQMTRGLRGSQLIVVFGDTGHRKSLFVQNVARKLGEKDVPILFIGLEMVNEENTERFLDMGCINLPLVYPPTSDIGYRDIDALVGAAVQEGVQLVVVDHLHMFEADGNNQAEGITNICIEMKRVTRKYNVPMILVSHISEDKNRQGPPQLKDLKGSSSIKQLADKAIAVYSPGVEYGDRDTEVELWLRKSRVKTERKMSTLTILAGGKLEEPAMPVIFS